MNTNMQEWREETAAIVNELLADGSNPDLDYGLSTTLPARSSICWRRRRSICSGRFRSDRRRGDGAGRRRHHLLFDAMVECKLDIDTIVADIEKMLPILEKYGWTTTAGAPTPRVSAPDHARFCKTTRPPSGCLVVAGLLPGSW